MGSRKNALDHLETAYLNGFSPLQTGCHVLIGDGLKGTDETLVPINGEYVKEAKALVDEAPKTVKEAVAKEEAEKMKAELEEAGAKVELK